MMKNQNLVLCAAKLSQSICHSNVPQIPLSNLKDCRQFQPKFRDEYFSLLYFPKEHRASVEQRPLTFSWKTLNSDYSPESHNSRRWGRKKTVAVILPALCMIIKTFTLFEIKWRQPGSLLRYAQMLKSQAMKSRKAMMVSKAPVVMCLEWLMEICNEFVYNQISYWCSMFVEIFGPINSKLSAEKLLNCCYWTHYCCNMGATPTLAYAYKQQESTPSTFKWREPGSLLWNKPERNCNRSVCEGRLSSLFVLLPNT